MRICRLAVLVAALALAAGCGGDDSPDERDAILRSVDAARDALVAGKPEEACALLTPHGRERATNFGKAYEDTPSCEVAARYFLEIEHDPRVNSQRLENLAATRFEVVDVDVSAARVSAEVGSIEPVIIEMRKTREGWRIHDSNSVPEGD